MFLMCFVCVLLQETNPPHKAQKTQKKIFYRGRLECFYISINGKRVIL